MALLDVAALLDAAVTAGTLEAAMDCWRGLQYDGKCYFYFNCYFFRTTLTNRDLREKAVYFPPRPLWNLSSRNRVTPVSIQDRV